MNTFQDNVFDFRLQGDLNLHYCGYRPESIDHKYVHRQNTYLLTFVCEGEATLTVGERTMSLTAGDAYVMFPSSLASYETAAGRPWSFRWVTLTGSQMKTLLPMLGVTPEEPILRPAESARAERLLEELFRKTEQADVRSKLAAMGLLYELFSCLAQRAAPTANATVAEAVRYMSRHYAEELTVHGLAERAFLNNNYFSKLFSEHVGLTPQQFLLKLRMERAKELLQYTDLTVGEVAAKVGFADALYFSRVFRRYAACSPTEFRRTK